MKKADFRKSVFFTPPRKCYELANGTRVEIGGVIFLSTNEWLIYISVYGFLPVTAVEFIPDYGICLSNKFSDIC
jgi:hypothetical protein